MAKKKKKIAPLEKTKALRKIQTFRPKRKLGQHFLKDPAVVHGIVEKAALHKDDRVLEIGPGAGALTFPLSGAVDEVYAVEKDPQLYRLLGRKLRQAGITNVTLFHEDILIFDPLTIQTTGLKKIKVLGNLPYNISSPVLEKLIHFRHMFSRAILMFQAEVGRRLTASPGTKAYGALSVITQYFARSSPLIHVSRHAFNPAPKVDSMVLELDFDQPYPVRAQDESHLRGVVKGAFAHRRKTLLNSLHAAFPSVDKGNLARSIERCGINPMHRAENLWIDDYLCLAAAFGAILDKSAPRC